MGSLWGVERGNAVLPEGTTSSPFIFNSCLKALGLWYFPGQCCARSPWAGQGRAAFSVTFLFLIAVTKCLAGKGSLWLTV